MAMKSCDICGKPYYRRNLVESWGSQNPGHRAGWTKASRRICTTCQGPDQSNRLLTLATLQLVGSRRRRRSEPVRHLAPAGSTPRRRRSAA